MKLRDRIEGIYYAMWDRWEYHFCGFFGKHQWDFENFSLPECKKCGYTLLDHPETTAYKIFKQRYSNYINGETHLLVDIIGIGLVVKMIESGRLSEGIKWLNRAIGGDEIKKE